MIITEDHIELSQRHFHERHSFSSNPSDYTNWFFWRLIRHHSDDLFYQRVNLLLFQKTTDVIGDLSQQPIEGAISVMSKHGVASNITLIAQAQISMLMAWLGPIFYANDQKLPMVKGEDLDKILDVTAPTMDQMEEYFEKFFEYNPYWYGAFAGVMQVIDKPGALAGVWAIGKVFIDSLPFQLEINQKYRKS